MHYFQWPHLFQKIDSLSYSGSDIQGGKIVQNSFPVRHSKQQIQYLENQKKESKDTFVASSL